MGRMPHIAFGALLRSTTPRLLTLDSMLSLLQRGALPVLRARRAFSSASARLSAAAQPAPSSSAVSAAEAEAHAAALAHAKRELVAAGYDADSLWEQRICWGDHDAVSLACRPPLAQSSGMPTETRMVRAVPAR